MLFYSVAILLCALSSLALASHDLTPSFESSSNRDDKVDNLKHHKAASQVSLVDTKLEIQLVDGNLVGDFSNETQTLRPGESFEDALSYIFGVYNPLKRLNMTPAIQSAFYEGLKSLRRSFFAYSNYYYASESVAYPVGYLKLNFRSFSAGWGDQG
jgi:hypothetical protein